MEGNLLITLLPTIAVALPTLPTIAEALPTLIALVAADVRFCQPGGDLRGGKRSQDQSKEERVHCWFDQSSNDPFASLSMSFCFLETRCRRNISPTSLSWLPAGRLVCLVTCFLGLPANTVRWVKRCVSNSHRKGLLAFLGEPRLAGNFEKAILLLGCIITARYKVGLPTGREGLPCFLKFGREWHYSSPSKCGSLHCTHCFSGFWWHHQILHQVIHADDKDFTGCWLNFRFYDYLLGSSHSVRIFGKYWKYWKYCSDTVSLHHFV